MSSFGTKQWSYYKWMCKTRAVAHIAAYWWHKISGNISHRPPGDTY
jgi:hypothetical protein